MIIQFNSTCTSSTELLISYFSSCTLPNFLALKEFSHSCFVMCQYLLQWSIGPFCSEYSIPVTVLKVGYRSVEAFSKVLKHWFELGVVQSLEIKVFRTLSLELGPGKEPDTSAGCLKHELKKEEKVLQCSHFSVGPLSTLEWEPTQRCHF